ncbi:MAG TPA: 50S ribosomal protein L32 [Candidatus Baltobacteraceae bacterium]|jgi:large subunit ribosomal protein L32|nr:50S ribosomal protein L32 [Candidatus Baltobacteraceae bacterium]
MANPKWKTPRSKTRSRRAANWRLRPVTTVACPQCHGDKLPHFVCPTCGHYGGRLVVAPRDLGAAHS